MDTNTKALMHPTVHSNGTSREDLMSGFIDGTNAVHEAIEALIQTAPHGRDYYPQGQEAWLRAHVQHSIRLTKLREVYAELVDLAEGLQS